MQNRTILRLYFIAVITKLLIAVAAVILTNAGFTDPQNSHLIFSNLHLEHIFEIYFSSDSGWYKVIAENGYTDIPSSETAGWSKPNLHFAFFPLFPMCIRWIMFITGTSFFAAGFIFNFLILYPLVRYFYLLLNHFRIHEKQAFRTVLILLLFPFSLHFYFNYTEALFFTFLVASFLFIAKKEWIKFAISSGLLVLTRPNGLAMLIPFLLQMLANDGGINLRTVKAAFVKPFYYALIVMPLAWVLWLIYQHHVTGNYFAFADAQSGWKKQYMFPLMGLFRNGFWQEQFDSIYCIIIMLAAIYWFRKWTPGFNALVWIGILLPLSAGSVISMTRYISVLFPFHMQFGQLKFTERYFKVIIAVFIFFQLVCLKYWLEGNSLMY